MTTSGLRPQILEQMSALSDELRGRILLALESQELTVSELCAVLQLPQSTVSRHLKTLSDTGWVVSRRDGTRRLYRMPADGFDASADQLWRLTRPQLRRRPTADQDARRLSSVLSERRQRSREFFASGGERWDALRDELFGPRFYLQGLPGLIDETWVVADLGCGSGALAAALAPFVRRVVALDDAEAMLATARTRLAEVDNVEIRRGDLEDLPLEDDSLDAAILALVLHHLPDPGKVLAEVARVLRPSGRVLIIDMLPHDRQEYQQEMGHVWMGFSEEQIARHLRPAGLGSLRFSALAPNASAKGPALFAATAVLQNLEEVRATFSTAIPNQGDYEP